jgi:predicted RNase H-like HicB family nuclease
MKFRVGLETNMEGRAMAWALEAPGCFAYGADGQEALANLPAAIERYLAWCARHGSPQAFTQPEAQIAAEETFENTTIDEAFELSSEGYEVDAWFRHDWKPLKAEDVAGGLQRLAWSRADLLAVVEGLGPEALAATRPGERWSIAGILKHVGGAEWWYLHQLGQAFPQEQLPKEPFERLRVVRAHLVEVLPTLVGSRLVVGVEGEFWSPRKVLRRAVWHELDHVEHVGKLVGSLP